MILGARLCRKQLRGIREGVCMYHLQSEPDEIVRLENGAELTPVATLADVWGGRLQVAKDDGHYVLALLSVDGFYKWVTHWPKEAMAALWELADVRQARLIRFADKLLP